MNELQLFNFDGIHGIRVVHTDNEPMFVARDVCDILELGDTSKAVERLSPSMKGTNTVRTPGGNQEMLTISEAGIYKLVFTSRKPEAERFTDWLASEVLPSIRKHGMYATDELLDNPDLLIQVATELKKAREEKKLLEDENIKQKQIIGELKPKADYTDAILKNKGLVTITQIAKDYGMSGQEMNDTLHDYGVQYKQSGQWLLYEKHHSKGYTHSETIDIVRKDGRPDVKMNTKWTQKGRLFIYALLKKNGLLPVIERN